MIDRYARQTLFDDMDKEGLKRLGNSCVVVIGCGAVGTVVATSLVRAGVGKMRIIDRDFIEYHNLQQHILFDEDDIKNQLPKAVAAKRHLMKVNSSVEIEGLVANVNYTNIENFVSGANLILDGVDNIETRLLINDVSLKHRIPWIYGEAVASRGMTINIIPGETPCFQCVFASPFSHGTIYTTETVGVISPATFVVGSLESVEAMKIPAGAKEISRDHIVIDVWKGTFHRLKIKSRNGCPACQGKYEFLEGKFGMKVASLCGQNAVQVINPKMERISLEDLATRLKPIGQVFYNEFMLRFSVDSREMVIFPEGRAIVKNTDDESLALGLYNKYIGG
ncbi:MAG: ThiF family adenylyltransferase [Chloroflexi bacterium]|nr:ThiF family adenylyltransferase [Chloroflexota bacterium]